MHSDLDPLRLTESIARSRLTLRFPRERRRDMVRECAGNHYSEEGPGHDIPVNLLSMYQTIIGRTLIAKNPRFLLTTYNRKQKPTVKAVQEYGNRELVKMKFANTMQRIVIDALYSIGIAKVALATPANAASKAWRLYAGKAFFERVDFDDFVYDVHGRDFDELGYIGHRYRVPFAAVKDDKIYSKVGRKNLVISRDRAYNTEGDERLKQLGTGYYANQQEFEDMVDLWEIYLPRHKRVLTFQADDGGNPEVCLDSEPLREQRWIGADGGPYHILGLGIASGNAMPKAPIMDLYDLHLNANSAYRKVLRMCARIKEITICQRGADADGNRVIQVNDGELIGLDNPDKIKQIVMGGNAVQLVLGVAEQFKALFNSVGGNLELLGGREPQAKTAHQEEMLNRNAGGGTEDMQDRVIQHVTGVIEALVGYWWNDPFAIQKSPHSLPSIPEQQTLRRVYPAQHPDQRQLRRQGPKPDVKVDAYSLANSTPQARMASIDQMVQTIIMPMMQLLQQQGINFDMNKYLQIKAEYSDMPELQELLTIRTPPEQVSQGGAGETPMARQTERTYNRVSIPGRSQQGDERNKINTLLGINPGGGPETAKNGMMNGAAR